MASKYSVEEIESLLADAFKTVMKASRETITVQRVFNPEVDLEAQSEQYTAMEEENHAEESQIPLTEDPTTLQGMRLVVSKVLKKTLKEVRKTACVELNFNKKIDEHSLEAVSKLLTAADYKKMKGELLPISHFLKKYLGVGHENYNTHKNHFQKRLKERKLEICRAKNTLALTRRAYGSLIVVYTKDDLPLMQSVLREVVPHMENIV
jgi:hypothetical protein